MPAFVPIHVFWGDSWGGFLNCTPFINQKLLLVVVVVVVVDLILLLKRVDAHAAAPGIMAMVSWNWGLESELLIWELGPDIRGV